MLGNHDVIVIGAGLNGLTCATALARRGRRVLLLERREIAGGLAAGEEFFPGYRSPGLLHDTTGVRRAVVQGLELERHGVRFEPAPPTIFVPQLDGAGLLLSHSPGEAAAEIAAHNPDDAQKYADFRAFLKRIAGPLSGALDETPADIYSLDLQQAWPLARHALALRRLGAADMLETLRILPMCMADWLNEWFRSELLSCGLAGPALDGTFLGPWSPGSNALLVLRECMAGGAVKGGPAALARGLEQAAREAGVTIRLGAEVERIRVRRGAVDGVVLGDGEMIDCERVISSCDPRQTFLERISSEHLPGRLEQRMLHYRMNGTTAKLHLALSGPLRFSSRPDAIFERVRTGERLDDLERAFDPAKYGEIPLRPMLDIWVPSLRDASLAPPGGAVVSILAHFVPYGLKGGWTDEQRARLERLALDELERYAPGVRSLIVACETLTPADIAARYGLTGGQVHHGEQALDQLALRPAPECANYRTPISGLMLCGAGSHPGGGLTCAPGWMAARSLLSQ